MSITANTPLSPLYQQLDIDLKALEESKNPDIKILINKKTNEVEKFRVGKWNIFNRIVVWIKSKSQDYQQVESNLLETIQKINGEHSTQPFKQIPDDEKKLLETIQGFEDELKVVLNLHSKVRLLKDVLGSSFDDITNKLKNCVTEILELEKAALNYEILHRRWNENIVKKSNITAHPWKDQQAYIRNGFEILSDNAELKPSLSTLAAHVMDDKSLSTFKANVKDILETRFSQILEESSSEDHLNELQDFLEWISKSTTSKDFLDIANPILIKIYNKAAEGLEKEVNALNQQIPVQTKTLEEKLENVRQASIAYSNLSLQLGLEKDIRPLLESYQILHAFLTKKISEEEAKSKLLALNVFSEGFLNSENQSLDPIALVFSEAFKIRLDLFLKGIEEEKRDTEMQLQPIEQRWKEKVLLFEKEHPIAKLKAKIAINPSETLKSQLSTLEQLEPLYKRWPQNIANLQQLLSKLNLTNAPTDVTYEEMSRAFAKILKPNVAMSNDDTKLLADVNKAKKWIQERDAIKQSKDYRNYSSHEKTFLEEKESYEQEPLLKKRQLLKLHSDMVGKLQDFYQEALSQHLRLKELKELKSTKLNQKASLERRIKDLNPSS